jgi:hypothetical protein
MITGSKSRIMKMYLPLFVLALVTIFVETSCTKDIPLSTARTIRFVLYTDKDFSDNNGIIAFSIFIKNHRKTLLDSSLAPMKLRDIPTLANKVIIEKKVPGDNSSDLAAGFRYTIKNVGSSRYIDTCKAGQGFKEVVFLFK